MKQKKNNTFAAQSIFHQLFFVTSFTIIVTFIAIWFIFLAVFNNYYVQRCYKDMEKDLSNVINEFEYCRFRQQQGVEGDVLKKNSTALVRDFMVVNSKGMVMYSSDVHSEKFESPDFAYIYEQTLKGKNHFKGKSGEGFSQDCYMASKMYNSSDGYYCIIEFSWSNQKWFDIWQFMQVFVITMLFATLICVVILYALTKKLTSPITQMAKAAEKIGQGNFSLRLPVFQSQDLQELGQAFNDMAQSLENHEQVHNSFIANVSHELRTPMTSIGGFADGILDGTIPPSQTKNYLRIISDETKRLTRLVRAMLNLSKLESGTMELQTTRFSVVQPIVATLVTFEKRLDEKNIEIRGLDIDRIDVEADEDLIHQVMYNLIENAIKFTDKGGYIEFIFEPKAHEKLLQVTIRNSGDGIASEDLLLVFDRFYKTDKSRAKDKNGVGLGLNIVRSIIHLHGGTVYADSKAGEYTEFVFTLPTA